MKKYEADLAGLVMGRDLVRCLGVPRRCLMPSDRDIKGNDVTVFGIGNSRLVPPVDKIMWDVEQKIRNRRIPVRLATNKPRDQLGDLGSDPGQC